MKMRKKKHLKRLTRKDQTDWYNLFFKPLGQKELAVRVELLSKFLLPVQVKFWELYGK